MAGRNPEIKRRYFPAVTAAPEAKISMKQQNIVRRISRLILIVLAAIWMLFEDWVWDSILALMERVSRLKTVHRLEVFIARQNQYLLLVFFCVPFLIMIPAKVYGLYLIANGKFLRGITIFIVAKGLITALITRLFVISKDTLLSMPAFAASYYWFKDKKDWLYAELNRMPAWLAAKRTLADLRRRIKEKLHSLRADR